MTLSWGVLPLGSLSAGYLLTTTGPAGTLGALAAVMLATALAATLSPAIRNAPPFTPRTDAATTAAAASPSDPRR